MTDKPFQSALFQVDQNTSNVAHFNEKFPNKPYLIAVPPSSQKLGHCNYKFLTF